MVQCVSAIRTFNQVSVTYELCQLYVIIREIYESYFKLPIISDE